MFSVSTFRTLGNAAVTQILFTIANASPADDQHAIQILGLFAVMDSTAAATTFAPSIKASRGSNGLPAGGSVLTPARKRTDLSVPSWIVCRGATASDGGAASPITATPGEMFSQIVASRLHTAVGQVLPVQLPILPWRTADDPIVLQAQESLIAHILAPSAAANPATNSYAIVCEFGYAPL